MHGLPVGLMKRLLPLGAVLAFGLGLLLPAAAAADAVSATVDITATGFSPAAVTVSPGGWVTWHNADSVVHSATAPGGAFDSGPINPGQQFTYRFNAAGGFSYSSYFDCHDDTGVWRQNNGAFQCLATVNVNPAATAPAAPVAEPAPAVAGPCQFVLGFATLHALDPADVGSCVDNQAFAANGDALQHTTKGLMVWRKTDNFTAFTNGFTTWVNGPYGLESRLNTARFPWEHDTVAAAAPASAPAPGSAAPAVQGNGSAASPIPLADSASNSLAPNGDVYYSLAYPGQNLSAKVRLYFTPSDISGNVGFTISGSQGQITPYLTGNGNCLTNVNGTSTFNPDCSSDDHVVRGNNQQSDALSASFTQFIPETYLIHIYNHRPNIVMNYTLSVSGIPYPCQPATAVGGSTAAQASVIGQPVVGQLGANTQGAYSYYRFSYAGDNSGLSLVLRYNPANPSTKNGVGMNLLHGSDIVLASNAQTMTQAFAEGTTAYADGLLTGFYQSQTPGDYYIQVNNFSGTAINYTLSLAGLPCPGSAAAQPAPAATPVAPNGLTSDTAYALNSQDARQLGGNSIGSFVWYSFNYDGQSRATLNMTFTPSDPLQSSQSGFNVYGPNGISLQAGQNGQGPGSLGLTLPGNAPAGNYHVQVFNYLSGTTISYTLSRP